MLSNTVTTEASVGPGMGSGAGLPLRVDPVGGTMAECLYSYINCRLDFKVGTER